MSNENHSEPKPAEISVGTIPEKGVVVLFVGEKSVALVPGMALQVSHAILGHALDLLGAPRPAQRESEPTGPRILDP